eukprot:TRINITY_DN4190_c0_g1_i8.p4 TRINITY_DN4190_c0_g1~~TRINITY_DN4190_c0_g1_i8.p4  ORF type:complete len:127 (-),score=26.12 TRINITY_DN4190_c0_g1_i8:944-1324(-)
MAMGLCSRVWMKVRWIILFNEQLMCLRSEYLGKEPKVSAFVSEFLKRRALDQQSQGDKKTRKGKKKRGKKSAGDRANQDEDEADDDQSTASKAGTKPKGKKGEPVDKSQWGFRTVGSQFGLLATDE